MSFFLSMGQPPLEFCEINGLKADPAAAVAAQHICLEVKADQRAGTLHQVEGGVKACDPGQVAGVAEQNRRASRSAASCSMALPAFPVIKPWDSMTLSSAVFKGSHSKQGSPPPGGYL